MADQEKILASKRTKLQALDDANGETYDTIQRHVKDFAMDTTGVRLNGMIEAFKAAGIGDEEFWLDFEIEFHEKVKEALEPMLARVQQQTRRANLSVVKKAPGKILGPDGRPIGG
jgi:hypothetical protein